MTTSKDDLPIGDRRRAPSQREVREEIEERVLYSSCDTEFAHHFERLVEADDFAGYGGGLPGEGEALFPAAPLLGPR